MPSNNLRKSVRRWQRTFNTICHLQPRQAWYFFLRRGIGARRVASANGKIALREIEIHPVLKLEHSDGGFSAYEFNFLNHAHSFPRNAMNWCPPNTLRLWRYNLHYFDFLRDPERPLQQKIALIDDWIANNPQGSEPAWEPYTASLRIVNWCSFFWSLPRERIDERWLQSLYTQARWLERNLELHILANHYFENIKAMLFAALFFDGSESGRWLARFQNELIIQLREQTLSDGGHYERSPQYHCILLEDYLDIYSLLSANATSVTSETLSVLSQTITSGLRFLALIVTPDDDIPLFNDSASGVASSPSALFAKAQRLGFNAEVQQSTLINLPDSGLFGWKSGGDYFLIDCGDIGPSYQPGHTHCDFLSFVLMIDHRWIVVDSGVCEYEPGKMREYVRSTRAHNTICIDDAEQSQVWGEFRVGLRAIRLDASISRQDHKILFKGSYKGFPDIDEGVLHRRTVTLSLGAMNNIAAVEIKDEINGANTDAHRIVNRLHLHPSLEVKAGTVPAFVEICGQKKNIAAIEGLTWHSGSAESWYCPEFGLSLPNPCLENVMESARLPVSLNYRIAVAP